LYLTKNDETKGIKDQDFSCSFSDSLTLSLVQMKVMMQQNPKVQEMMREKREMGESWGAPQHGHSHGGEACHGHGHAAAPPGTTILT